MKIGFTYDVKTDWQFVQGDPVDANAEFDKPETIESIVSGLESGGHTVLRIGNVEKLIKQLPDLDVDIVLNICEGRNGRNRESQVPILLEMQAIPYVGSDAMTLGLTLDKVMAKKCFIADGIPTPRYFLADSPEGALKQNQIGFPLMVKTRHEGTSKGITKDSRVMDDAGLMRQVEMINKEYKQAALIEEFIRGQEFTVAVLGNKDPKPMPIVQVSINGSTALGDGFYSQEYLTSSDLKYVCPAQISKELEKTIQDLAVRAYKSVDCRDFGRVDFRVDEKGNPHVLEINPLPNLGLEDVFNIYPYTVGSTYEAAINQIIDIALERCGQVVAKR